MKKRDAAGIAEAIANERDDRYHRLKLIKWWDQKRLADARVMVVGAGALGNEIVKNLALLGVGNILVCDMDHVEPSNLSRAVLFRKEDEGLKKAEVAARRARDLNPDCGTAWFHGDVATGLGGGVFKRMDVVIGGLDNREARIAVNAACWKFGVPYVDGGTDQFHGQVRVFAPPDGPCYECTLTAEIYAAIRKRRRCNLLLEMPAAQAAGKVATTPFASSVIAAIEVQEAVELLHGHKPPRGKTIVFNGATHEGYESSYAPRDNEFHRHAEMECCVEVSALEGLTSRSTVAALARAVRREMGEGAVADFPRIIVGEIACPRCEKRGDVFRPLDSVRRGELKCPACGETRRHEIIYSTRGDEPWAGRALEEMGLPPLEVFSAHRGPEVRYFEVAGDAPRLKFGDAEAL